MFDNIGEKIKKLAQITCWIGIGVSVIWGLVLMFTGHGLGFLGFRIMIIGSVVSWISSFALYGYGELIENTEIISYNTKVLNRLLTNTASEQNNTPDKEPEKSYYTPIRTTITSSGGWLCKKCSTINDSNAQYCKDCGAYR